MKVVDRRAMLAVLSATAAYAPSALAQQLAQPGLDGDWEGTLDNITGPGIAPPPDGDFPRVRLQIDQRNVRVFLGQEEAKSGTFEIRREGNNAVVTSIQSDPDAPVGRSWTETWTFVLTLADPDTLIVNYVRIVNNNQMAASEDGARFSQIRTGQFRRVRPNHVR